MSTQFEDLASLAHINQLRDEARAMEKKIRDTLSQRFQAAQKYS